METGVVKVTFKDGRIFKVFYQNKHQKNRITNAIGQLNDEIAEAITEVNGIHTTKQFENFIKNEL